MMLRADVEVGRVRAVHEDVLAEDPGRADEPLREVEPAVVVEVLVLEDHRDVIDAVRPRQAQALRLGVVDEDHPGDAPVDLLVAVGMRMRVVPERGRGLVDRPAGGPPLARLDRLVGPAVGGRREVHAVPVHRRPLGQLVPHLHPNAVPAGEAERRPEVGSVDAPRLGRRAGHELARPGLEPEVEDRDAVAAGLSFEQWRDPQLVREVELPDGARIRPRI